MSPRAPSSRAPSPRAPSPRVATGSPPPLPRSPLPRALRWRVLAWRMRFVAAAACVGLAVTAALRVLAPSPEPTVPVVVTAHGVEAGVVLAASDLRVARVPVGLAPEGVATTVATVRGTTTAVPLGAGTPLVPGVLAPTDVRGPDGTVVAAVRLADEAAARLLSAGMHVDVVAATAEGATGRTVARRALVLPTPAAAGARDDGGGLLGGSTTDDASAPPVLLAVSPDEATAVAGASASALLSAVVVP